MFAICYVRASLSNFPGIAKKILSGQIRNVIIMAGAGIRYLMIFS